MSLLHPTDSEDPRRALLSALMDGDGTAADDACRLWRGDAGARADWHAYHLIGDVLRSDEHGCDAARDARLLARVREQMAAEPVVLAPEPVRARPDVPRQRRARSWMAPTAVAAGFFAVAGALVVTRVPPAPDGGALTASTAAPAGGVRAVAAAVAVPAASASTPAATLEYTPMLRSAELDRYLAAHRQYANGAVLVAPGGGVRNAAATAPGR
jgi:sigma-E factor negative regulatory protein RseA